MVGIGARGNGNKLSNLLCVGWERRAGGPHQEKESPNEHFLSPHGCLPGWPRPRSPVGANLSAAWRAAQTNFRVGPLGYPETADLTRPRVSREHGSFGECRNNGLGTKGTHGHRACG